MNDIRLKLTTNAIRLIVRPQPAIQVKIARSSTISTNSLPLSDSIVNVTTAGTSVQFNQAFPDNKYNLDIHCYPSGTFVSPEGEIGKTVVKSTTGFNVFPDFNCGLITWSASPRTVQAALAIPARILSRTTSDTGSLVIPFGATYAVDNYNVAYVRGYLTADETVAVPITSITKGTTGLTVLVPTDGVTIEWCIELITV